MRSRSDFTPFPFSVFSPEFLRWLEELDEPVTAAEADAAGPWHLEPHPGGGWAVLPPGDSLARGDEPEAVFFRLEHAIQAAVVFPTTGRDDLFVLHKKETRRGYAVDCLGERAGYLRLFNPNVAAGLHVTDSILRAPDSLGRLIRAAGGLALSRADKILLERLLVHRTP